MKNNFDRLLEEGVLDDIGNSIKNKVKDHTIAHISTDAAIEKQKRRKDAANKKIQAHQLKKDADEAIKKSKNLGEKRLTHKELRDLGVAGAEKKPDGSNVHRYGKNYLIGYYKKKIEDAKRDGDKFALKLAKDSIKSIEAAEGRLGKGRIRVEPTPEGS